MSLTSQSISFNPLRYVLYDLVTATFLGFIPLNGVTFSSVLNGVGQFSGTIDLSSAAVQNINPIALTQPGRTALFVDYDGALVWGGIIWQRNYVVQGETRVLTVTASELWSFIAQRVQATDYSSPPYSGLTGPSTMMAIWGAASADTDSEWDPVLMAWQMIADAFGSVTYGYGNILGGMGILANSYGLQSGAPTNYLASGTNTPLSNYINFTAPYTSRQLLGTMVPQLQQLGLEVGFDFGVDVAYSGGPGSFPVATVNISYPRRGRTFANNGIVLNAGNAITYTPPEDATQAANTIYEAGVSGSLVIAQNLDMFTAGWPQLEKVVSRSTLGTANAIALLEEVGESDIFQYSYPVVTPSVTVDLFGTDPVFGSFITGDDAQFLIPPTDGLGNVFDPRFPTGLNQEWRIQQWTANVPDEGQATLQIILNNPPLLGLPPVPVV